MERGGGGGGVEDREMEKKRGGGGERENGLAFAGSVNASSKEHLTQSTSLPL